MSRKFNIAINIKFNYNIKCFKKGRRKLKNNIELKEKTKQLKIAIENKLAHILVNHAHLIAALVTFSIYLGIMSGIMASILFYLDINDNNKNNEDEYTTISYEDVMFDTVLPIDDTIDEENIISIDFRKTTQLLSEQRLENLDILRNERERFIHTTIIEDGITYEGEEDIYTYYSSNNLDNYSLLLLMGITNSNYFSYYDAVEYFSIDSLYNFFNAKTDEEKENIQKVLNIYNELQDDNLDFNKKAELESLYRLEIFRISIKNIIDYSINNSDFYFQDNVTLYKLIKNVLFPNNYLEQNNLDKIEELENGYINFLARHYNWTEFQVHNYLKDYLTIFELKELQSLVLYGKFIELDYVDKKYRIEHILKLASKFPFVKTISYIHSYEVSDNMEYNETLNLLLR